jgi:nicotinate-nucleotide adenylyltransferase
MEKRRIGLFGGSFNPPTKAHLYVAEQLIERGIVDEVQFVPAYVSYHHKEYEATPQQRCDMIQLMIEESKFEPVLYVNDFEIVHQMQSSTYDFIKEFFNVGVDLSDEIEYYFIVGGDNAKKVPNFINGEELIKAIPFIVVNRGHQTVDHIEWCSKDPHIVVELGNKHDMDDCSSTDIRNEIRTMESNGLHCNFFRWCTRNVFAYILNKDIYMDGGVEVIPEPEPKPKLSWEEQKKLDWETDYSDSVTWEEFKEDYQHCSLCGNYDHYSYGQCICYAR